MPKLLSAAGKRCRTEFWRSLILGTATVAGALLLIRLLFLSVIGTPLAFAFIAALELGLLLGLATVSATVGVSVLGLLPVTRSRTLYWKWIELTVGALLVSTLLLIPAIGILPPLGIRLVTLLAVLGLGSLISRNPVLSS
jgi:hypothetical protein